MICDNKTTKLNLFYREIYEYYICLFLYKIYTIPHIYYIYFLSFILLLYIFYYNILYCIEKRREKFKSKKFKLYIF